MNKLVITTGILALLALGAGRLSVSAQDEGAAMLPPVLEQHEWLAKGAGDWDATLLFHTPEGDIPLSGVETSYMFGSYHLVSDFEGDMMGLPFAGKGTTSYDPVGKTFTGSWMDTMTPTVSFMTGRRSADKSSLTMSYEAPNMVGKLDRMKSTLTIADADHKSWESWIVTDEGETKQMTINYTRRKAAGGMR